MGRLQEIELRMTQISKELENENADIEALEKEVNELTEERKALLDKAEKRKALLARAMTEGTVVGIPEEEKEERKMNEENILSTKQYRNAFLKNLQKKDLNELEERAMSTATNSVGAVIPTITQDLIIEKVFEEAPLLSEIELLRVEGNVTFSVETDATEATIHTEGATLTDDGDVLIPVSLSAYEINKYVTISKSVQKMSIDAFEKWLVNMLGRMIARKITKLIINGTGSSQPKGIAKANTWDETNSVTVTLNATLAEKDVTDLTALLPEAYDKRAKWLMSKKTLLKDFRPLQNKSKNDIFVRENGKYYVEGYEVMLDSSVTEHDAYLGDFKMYVGNLSEDVNVDNDKQLSKNSFEFLGSAMFDGKPAVGEAFVKLTKASS